MERKTKINAEDGKQEVVITREFDLPLELLFKAYTEPGIVEQWMGTKVLKLENKKHGSYQFETTDPRGTNTNSMGQSMSLFRTTKSPGHLKWRIHHLTSSLSSWNLNNLPATPANSKFILYTDLLHSGIKCCSCHLLKD